MSFTVVHVDESPLGDESSMVIWGDATNEYTIQEVLENFVRFPLIICDPPYGDIVNEKWDKGGDDYPMWMAHCASLASNNAVIAMWGGIGKAPKDGKPGNRAFLKFAATVEEKFPGWSIKNWITWSKKRAYGVQDNYLFTREECLILTRGEPTFNIPLLSEKRGYAGYNAKYPAKSEYFRRTNVWTDITELFRGKVHPCQKPEALYKVLIETHTDPGDVVYDPCAGSLVTRRAALMTGRRYCVVEKDRGYIADGMAYEPTGANADAQEG